MTDNLPKRQRGIVFYPADWRADPVWGCSFAAQHVWWVMCQYMELDSPEPGYWITRDGEAPSSAWISRHFGRDSRSVSAAIRELIREEIASVDPRGFIFSRRIVRQAEISKARASAGKTGGSRSALRSTSGATSKGESGQAKVEQTHIGLLARRMKSVSDQNSGSEEHDPGQLPPESIERPINPVTGRRVIDLAPHDPTANAVWVRHRELSPGAKLPAQLPAKEGAVIAERLAEGFTKDDLWAALAGGHADPFLIERNQRRLTTILKDASAVSSYIAASKLTPEQRRQTHATKSAPPEPAPLPVRNLAAEYRAERLAEKSRKESKGEQTG